MEKAQYYKSYPLFKKLIFLYLYISILLPGGGVYNINIKLIFLVVACFFLLLSKSSSAPVKFIILMIPPVLFVFLELMYSFLTYWDISSAINQAIDILLCFILPALFLSAFSRNEAKLSILPMINNAIYVTAIVKIIILLYSLLTGIPASNIVQSIALFFNTNIMTFDVEGTFAARINFPSDFMIFITTFFLVNNLFLKKGGGRNYLLLILVSSSFILSMSRYIWAINAIAIGMAILINIKNKKSLALVFLIFIFGAAISQIGSVQDIFMSRYDSGANSYSDAKRDLQEQSILDSYATSPWLGTGLGSHASLLRSFTPGKKYIYELQLQAFLMQVGVIGVSLFIILLLWYMKRSLKGVSIKYNMCILVFFSLWLVSSLFNPSLFTSSGGAVFLYIVCLSYALHKQYSND